MAPHSLIDTEAGWSKSGWHGRWYGWKRHLTVTVSTVWSPFAAEFAAVRGMLGMYGTYDSVRDRDVLIVCGACDGLCCGRVDRVLAVCHGRVGVRQPEHDLVA